MSSRNGAVFRSLAGGHSDRPAPEALRANAPTNVRATAPPMTPAVRGLRFAPRHRSSPYRCARRSSSFAAHCARRSAPCTFGIAIRRVFRIARRASCTGDGWRRLLIGGGVPGSGIPENGLLIFLRPRKNSGFSSPAGGRNRARIVKLEFGRRCRCESCDQSVNPQSHGASRQKLHLPRPGRGVGKTQRPVGQCARRFWDFMMNVGGRSVNDTAGRPALE
jgi:hypothetical protein